MNCSRKKNAARNILSGLLNKFIISILPFIIRTVIIYTLGELYVGLNGLFISILGVLSLAELGLNEAIVFSLYEPIEKRQTEKINHLMAFYKKAYTYIGIFIFLVSLSLMPFIKCFIKGDCPSNINIYVLYLAFVFNTVFSYLFFAYKNTLFVAHQRSSVLNNVTTIVLLLQYAAQILVLLVTKNYYLYVFMLPLFTLLRNWYIAHRANIEYPNYKPQGRLDRKSLSEIAKMIRGLIYGKISDVARNSFDSIIISSFMGLTMVAKYSNYYMIYTTLFGVVAMICSSLQAGVGSSIVTDSVEKNYKDFKLISFIIAFMTSIMTLCMFIFYQPFMHIWVGDKLMLSKGDMLLFCIYFFLIVQVLPRNLYMNGNALWDKSKKWFVIEAICNLVLNIFLGKAFGVTGVLIASNITIFLFNFLGRNRVVFEYYFGKEKKHDYYSAYFKYCAVMSFVIAVSNVMEEVLKFKIILLTLLVVLLSGIMLLCVCYALLFEKSDELLKVKKMFLK